MGGLRKYLKITHWTFLIACLTIAGLFPLSGFWSKDEILVAAYNHNKLLFWIEYLVAGLTAFYMFRLYFRVFWNKEPHYHHTPHESPLVMTIPLMFLALASIFAGFLPFSHMVSSDRLPFATETNLTVAIPSVAIGLLGILIAFLLYKKDNNTVEKIVKGLGGVYKTIYNKFYIDEVYLFVTKKIIFNLISRPVAWFDRHVVDGTMNGIAGITVLTSRKIKGSQSGQLQHYAFFFVLGAIVFALIFIYLW